MTWTGGRAKAEGRSGPHIFIAGAKADTARWMPLHPAAVETLAELRRQPKIGAKVLAVKSRSPGTYVSKMFARLCIETGVTDANGSNRWSLHDLRRKANTDLRNRGASPKGRAALLGHRTTVVNEEHYEAALPARERELIDGLKVFGKVG